MRYAGGISLSPVQKLVASLFFACKSRQKCYRIPHPIHHRNPGVSFYSFRFGCSECSEFQRRIFVFPYVFPYQLTDLMKACIQNGCHFFQLLRHFALCFPRDRFLELLSGCGIVADYVPSFPLGVVFFCFSSRFSFGWCRSLRRFFAVWHNTCAPF